MHGHFKEYMMDKAQQDALKKAAGIEAAKLVENGMIAGLGTGSTVKFLVDELGRLLQRILLCLIHGFSFAILASAARINGVKPYLLS